MAEFRFTSPGVKFAERDLTYVTRNVGVTTLGLVGETLKGPAFEPIYVQDKREFQQRFGRQSIERLADGNLQYQLPYVANAYLNESSQLWVTRVLGLSGYDAGEAWAITVEGGVDPDTIVTGATTTGTSTFSNYTYLGVALNDAGDVGISSTGFTKAGSTFSQTIVEFTATTVNPNGNGTAYTETYTLTGSELTEYNGMVVALIRSRGFVHDNQNAPTTTEWDTTSLTLTGANANDMFAPFTLVATNTSGTEQYVVSLDPNSSSFVPNVVGRTPKDKTTKIWVEAIYPDLIKKLDAEGYGWGVKGLINFNNDAFSDYKTQFLTPETPWIVSQLNGNKVDKLFKFISISDGNSANREIKISITDINPISKEFDVVIRDFNDTDDNPIVLEQYNRCSLIKGQSSYIGRKIGTSDGEYILNSEYVMVEIAENLPTTVFPAGFEGYLVKEYSGSSGLSPKIFYKTQYFDEDRVRKTYLGISEKGYSAENLAGAGVNQNLFNFYGLTGFKNTKGFHMDSGATAVYDGFEFEVGGDKFQTINDVQNPSNAYNDIRTRKFTLVPAGGFDGWNVNRGVGGYERSHGDLFRDNGIFDGVNPNEVPKNDFQAWETAINTFANPEEITINVFATPGINWSDNNLIVQNTIEMIETQRTDSLYVIDSPSLEDVGLTTIGDGGKPDVLASREIVDMLEDAEIDSSYACTYFPWIQIRDTENNVNVYIPPTGEVVKSIAYTDNTSFPWFAVAGLNRGVTDARKSRYKLSLEARDILYLGRINPLADFAEVGTAIFGQKTLQVRESALDRINVRRLLLQIKVLISNIAVRLVFEQNDQATIDQFLQKATPVLDTIKRERGLTDFRIKMDDTNNTPETRDRNELFGEIFLKPTRSLEFIGITFTITPSGASFDDVGA